MGDISQVLGVFSKNIKDYTGAGATMQRSESKTYYYVTRSGVDKYQVQPLNEQNIPSGMVIVLNKKEFITQYAPELKYYEKKTLPALKSLKAKIDKGEKQFIDGNLDEAEQSFAKALFLDPEHPKANLGMGSVQCSKQNFTKLSGIVDRLLNNDAVFMESQRQEFNLFAITLRKQTLFDEAITFYNKAIEINPNDENLHFNTARAYFDAGDNDMALEHLDKALEIAPTLEVASMFKKYIVKRKGK
ncbi:tetratricopeptide repeat protein [Desulfovibrio sp. JC010]|uniref:tetratricopeptide repeat protein n=1 Tax=Desulfovibrio sp. JC010 TaxID=2593641 RepID=UPI0013D1E187|nr:tetratricopeptide repeat protein [Desulfovibrio sp. JC010]NDV25722.1 tetratricopeptide repeat protein [Desulfovibrio sp. JC010]